MCCNAIFSVCKAYRAQKALGRVTEGRPVPSLNFRPASVHFDKRTYTLRGEFVSLNTLRGRVTIPLISGAHQRQIIVRGFPKEADLVCRKGTWYLNVSVEIADIELTPTDKVMGVDVGEINLAAASSGQLWGGQALRHRRDQHLALRRRLQSNGSQSARQKLRQVSGREKRRARHINHETSRAVVREALKCGASRIILEDLTHIRDRIRGGRRARTVLHRWSFAQLQAFIAYKAADAGIAVAYVAPAYTSQTCSNCGALGIRARELFTCSCGLRTHADLNASRNLARIGSASSLRTAVVNTPNVGCMAPHASP